ncbi:MAG: CBS domain-containing protein [Canidatus Methanoxibalbensis ujae]|nr:CBS domain-containing protein [Candidatus Methanoxibalbensis ujae]
MASEMTELLEVRDVMTPEVVTEEEDTPVTKIAKDMEVYGIGSVIITREGEPVGIVTDRDIALKVIKEDRLVREVKAKDIMSSPLITIEADASIEKACEIMAKNRIRRLPVVEDDKLVGVISVRNILTRSPACVSKFYPAGEE